MRILLISHTCQSRAEGQRKAERLARMPGVELTVLAPQRFNHYGVWRYAEQPDDAGFRFLVRRAMWPWLGPLQNYMHWYPGLAKVVREVKPDIIDLWEEPWSLASAHACWIRGRFAPRAKIVMESEQNIFKRFVPPFCWFEKYTINHADFAVGRSSQVLEVLRRKGYRKRARFVGNAADTSVFRPLNRAACKQALGFTKFTAGYAGRLVERKGLMDMIDALAFLPEDVQLVFVGDGEFKPQLEARIAELGKKDQVTFLPGRPLEQLPEVMNAFDAFVLPSWTVPSWKEQFGRVIIEAHACETPVLGSNSGAIPEIVAHGGLIFPERDPQALAASILKLKDDPARAWQLGVNGRRQVEERYTWEKVAAQMRDIYFETAR